MRGKVTALFTILTIMLYSGSDDFCDDIYEMYVYKSDSPQDKYLTAKLDKLAKGSAQEKQDALKDLLKIIKKKRLGKCSVKFLESINTYINDYIQSLGNTQEADEITVAINELFGNTVSCLSIRNDLNLKLKVKLPSSVCEIEKCQNTLTELTYAFGSSGSSSEDTKELLLTIFLELFWKGYYTSNKMVKNKIKDTWTKKVCDGINYIKELMLKEGNVIDSRSLIGNEEFNRSVSEVIVMYFGRELLPACGAPCAYKIMEIASKRTLKCELRAQLLALVSEALTSSRTAKILDLNSQIKLFATFEKLTKDKCYDIQYTLTDVLFKLELYKNDEIMDIILKRILSNVSGYSPEQVALKSDIVSGFVNISNKRYDIKKLEELLLFFEREFEVTKNYEYKELLLKVLFAFNRYGYILKNEKKLFEEYKSRLKEKNINMPISTQDDLYTVTLLQVAAFYGLESFQNYIQQSIPVILKNLEQVSRDDDRKYFFILVPLFGYNDKRVEEYLLSTLNGVATGQIKQYAFRSMFYNVSRRELVSNLNKFFENPDIGCLSYLVGATVGDVTTLKKLDSIDECEKIKTSTKAVKELIKVAMDKDWWKNLKSNPEAMNILNLNLSTTDKFVTYDTCNVGHKPIGAPPTFIKNVIYGLECDEICDSGGCYCPSCDKLALVSSLLYLNMNNLNRSNLFKKLEKNTEDVRYAGKLKNILRKIARELNVTADFSAFKRGPLKYILDTYSVFILPSDKQTKKSINSYKTLLTKISERFLITFIFFKGKESHSSFIKVLPFESASNRWSTKLNKIFAD